MTERRPDIGLDTLIDSIRQCAPDASSPRTIAWRMGVLRELCRIVETAHARGLAHPCLTTRDVRVDGLGTITVLGWQPQRAPFDAEADIQALGAIAFELLTLQEDPEPVQGRLPHARIVARPLLVESGVFVAFACIVGIAIVLGPRVTGLAALAVLAITLFRALRRRAPSV